MAEIIDRLATRLERIKPILDGLSIDEIDKHTNVDEVSNLALRFNNRVLPDGEVDLLEGENILIVGSTGHSGKFIGIADVLVNTDRIRPMLVVIGRRNGDEKIITRVFISSDVVSWRIEKVKSS